VSSTVGPSLAATVPEIVVTVTVPATVSIRPNQCGMSGCESDTQPPARAVRPIARRDRSALRRLKELILSDCLTHELVHRTRFIGESSPILLETPNGLATQRQGTQTSCRHHLLSHCLIRSVLGLTQIVTNDVPLTWRNGHASIDQLTDVRAPICAGHRRRDQAASVKFQPVGCVNFLTGLGIIPPPRRLRLRSARFARTVIYCFISISVAYVEGSNSARTAPAGPSGFAAPPPPLRQRDPVAVVCVNPKHPNPRLKLLANDAAVELEERVSPKGLHRAAVQRYGELRVHARGFQVC